MNKAKQADAPVGRIRYSITHKLNRKLFVRLFFLFVSINITICIIAAAGLAVYCEEKAVSVSDKLRYAEPPEDGRWSELSGVYVRRLSELPRGFTLDGPFAALLPRVTETAVRGFSSSGTGFRDTIRSITYVVNVTRDDTVYEISMCIGPFIQYFIYAFIALNIYELIELISRSGKDRRMVRKTLDPISELARAAQSLNSVSERLDQEKMAALAGRLAGIDGNKLDTRIQVDDLQEELRNLALAINGMLDRINESYITQARFVSDASHELRTPISVIQGYANLLDRWGKEDEKTLSESISAIKDEAENMKDLVEQLLFLARGDSNTIRLAVERIELAALVDEVVSETRMLDGGHEFKVKESGASVVADRPLIKQALRILVDNAVKYTDTGGEITVSATGDGEYVRIAVSDNGIGISPEILPNVFDRFVRADESRARATGGAGLGLSIAHWVASRHGGHIEALSREGIGTKITLVLPTAPDTALAEDTQEEDVNTD